MSSFWRYIFCCCCDPLDTKVTSYNTRIEPVEVIKPTAARIFTDPVSAIRVEPPEGFDHYYPHGTVFPGEELPRIPEKESDEKRELDGVAEDI